MKIVYLVVTSPDLQRVVVMDGTGGWRLPRWDRLKRIPPADDCARDLLPWPAHLSPTNIVHWGPLPPQDASDTADRYYCLAVTTGPSATLEEQHNHFALSERRGLLSFGHPSALDAQEQLAIRMALGRVEAPEVMFDSPVTVDSAIRWAEDQIAEKTSTRITSVARYRHNRRDLIVRFEAGADAFYLKAGKERLADEAPLTQYLHALLPRRVPETLAIDSVNHRWLYRELPGVMMASAPQERDTIVAAVRALVSLQQATKDSEVIASHVAPRRQSAVALFHAVDAFLERAWRSVQPTDALAPVWGMWSTLREAMIRACKEVDTIEVPEVLVPSDFWSQNILITPSGIGFIDLGHSYWSCPVLPLWRFVRDIKGQWSSSDRSTRASIRQEIGEAFVDAWAPMVSPRVMTRAIAQLWLIGRLFGIQIAAYDLDLYEEALGTELPAGYRAARLEERVCDLSRAFAQHLIVPRHAEPELAAALDL